MGPRPGPPLVTRGGAGAVATRSLATNPLGPRDVMIGTEMNASATRRWVVATLVVALPVAVWVAVGLHDTAVCGRGGLGCGGVDGFLVFVVLAPVLFAGASTGVAMARRPRNRRGPQLPPRDPRRWRSWLG